MIGSVPPELLARLNALQNHGQGAKRAEIAEVVSELMSTLDGDITESNLKIFGEVESLARYIATAKSEIAALRPDKIKDRDLPTATDELDAIVGATEEATNGILHAMETLETLVGEMPPELSEKVTAAVTQVYEACNFQDITGQRINRIVKTLKDIEERVDALVGAFGEEIAKYKQAHPDPVDDTPKKPTDADLLNGPQLPDEAAKQVEIDALLASFD
jgi:chemotaxis protein CheZ